MRQLCDQAGTILVVSHALKGIRRLCNEVLWLNEGQIVMRDEPQPVIEAYRRFVGVGEGDDAAFEDI
jgi:teichoic acid transport system ATP-binding protein